MPEQPTHEGGVQKRPELEAALRESGVGIGKVIRWIKAAPLMEEVVRDVTRYRDVLPEEVTEPARAAVDILEGGDGAIYR